MLELSRTVRFCLSGKTDDLGTARDNTFSAWPAMRGLGRYYELVVTCAGEADPETGYFINIKQIDQVVRKHALPILVDAVVDEQAATEAPMGRVLHKLLQVVGPPLGGTVTSVALVLTPFLQLIARADDMGMILMRQQYEFAAAHRLHVDSLSDEANYQIFGKCNNLAGHGHNYRVEVVVRCPIDAQGQTLSPAALDAVVNASVVEQLDHKHLNHDVPDFAELNPSVENIAKVVWSMLRDKMPAGVGLDEVRIWETGKTVCAYRGDSSIAAP